MAKARSAAASGCAKKTHSNVISGTEEQPVSFWEECRGHLCGLGLTAAMAGSITGMLLKRHGPEVAIELIREAASRCVISPIPWLQRCSAIRMQESDSVGAAANRIIGWLAVRVFLDMGGDPEMLGAGVPYSREGLRHDLPDLFATHFPEAGRLPAGWQDRVIDTVGSLFMDRMGISDPWHEEDDYLAWRAWSSDPLPAFAAMGASQ